MGQPLWVGLEQRPSLIDESLHRVEAFARRERPHAGPLDAVAWLKVGARRRDVVVYDDSILVATWRFSVWLGSRRMCSTP